MTTVSSFNPAGSQDNDAGHAKPTECHSLGVFTEAVALDRQQRRAAESRPSARLKDSIIV